MNKSEIRKKIFKTRKIKNYKNLKIDFKSLLEISKKKKTIGKDVGGYYPYNYEVDIMEILKKLEKYNYQISLPKVKKKSQMDFFRWSTKDPLEINKYGIPEPISDEIKYPGVLLVPLVAFDRNLNRIGYGGGFYDRYISRVINDKKIIKIGLGFSFQKVKNLPTNQYDKKLDYVITEKGFAK